MMKRIQFFILLFLLVFSFTVQSQSTKALYVNDLKNFIGNEEKENDLLQYAVDSSYNYLLFYNINFIHNNLFDITDPVTAEPLSKFIKKAKVDYGIAEIGAVGEKFASFQPYIDYNLDHLCEPEAMFDVFNLEFEFWNTGSTGPGGYYCTTYLEPNGFPCTKDGAFDFIYPQLCQLDSLCDLYPWLNSEIYIGKPTALQCAKLPLCVDRVLVHYYRSSDVYNNGNSIYNYNKYRLEALTDSVDLVRVMPIFSGRSTHMGTWLETHAEAKAYDTWLHGQNSFDDESGPWLSKIQIDGYTWYRYTAMHDTVVTRYYVSTTGDDASDGSQASPWATIDHACNNATPDSKIIVSAGTYNEQVSVGVDNIEVSAQGGMVIIDGTGLTSGPMVQITDRNKVTFDGFEIRNAVYNDAQGVLISGVCRDITIKNCRLHDIHFSSNPMDIATASTNAQPIIVYGDQTTSSVNINLEHNEIYNCRVGYSEALAVNGNVDTFSIVGNIVHDVPNIGIDIIGHEGTCSDPLLDQARHGLVRDNTVHNCQSPYAANAGIYVDGGKDLVIDGNTCYRNIWGIEIGCENGGKTTSNIVVKNNVIFKNTKSGLIVGGYDYPSGSGKVTDVNVIHNTFYENDTLNTYEADIQLSYIENVEIKGNIVYSTNPNNIMIIQYSDTPPLSVSLDSNIYYHPVGLSDTEFEWQGTSYTGFASWSAGTGQDVNTDFLDPLFVDIASSLPDLHLATSSLAIGNGLGGLELVRDRDNEPRPKGAKTDTGAYENGNYWTGAVNYTWSEMGNWSQNVVPSAADEVTIPSPEFYRFFPQVLSTTSIRKLYLDKKSKVWVKSPTVLDVKM